MNKSKKLQLLLKKNPSRFLEVETRGVFSGFGLGGRLTEVALLGVPFRVPCSALNVKAFELNSTSVCLVFFFF